jgi:hypothetical protein
MIEDDEISDRCQWPGCGETDGKNLRLSATADEFFVLCTRHVEAVRNGEFELSALTPAKGRA